MTHDILAKIQETNIDILTDIVRKDQSEPAFEIIEWSAQRLSDKGLNNPDGLWRVNGRGCIGRNFRNWSVVLKIINSSQQIVPLEHKDYWKREVMVAQSGLTMELPGPVHAPRFYRVDEQVGSVWLWMEYIENQRTVRWVLEDFAFAAYQLGCWHGALQSHSITPEPWFARQHYRVWEPFISRPPDWQFSLHQKYMSDNVRNRFEQMCAERAVFYQALETLPQSFQHLDCHRRNLMIHRRQSGQDELVPIDWALCGMAPMGVELHPLINMSCLLLEWNCASVKELDRVVFANYMQGLHDVGWVGNVDLVRLGYTAWAAMHLAMILPHAMANWFCSSERRTGVLRSFGRAEADLYVEWLPLFERVLDCGDEARNLVKRLT